MPFLTEKRGSLLTLLHNAARLRCVLPGLLSLALALPVQAECSRNTAQAPSRQVQALIDSATDVVVDASIAGDLLSLQYDIRCGDADAIATLKPFLNQPDTALLAAYLLLDAGQLQSTELLHALERAPLPLERKADLLETAADWPVLQNAKTSAASIIRSTEWAIVSGNEKLARLASELRAMHGDDAAITARADRLQACAEIPDGGIGMDCLGMHELHTAPFSLIEARWDAASMPMRFWLARWARRAPDNQAFLLERLPAEHSKVQYQILIEAMEGGETREYAVKAALALIQQAATQPYHRPRAVSIDFSTDYREGMFGIQAYESGEDYPIALQAAFEELATYPYEDAGNAMLTLVLQDHPWLATQAGIWLVRHGQAQLTTHALRYTLEADGLPPESVLSRLHPLSSNDDIPHGTRELFLATIENGALGKWKAFAESPYDTLLDDPGVTETIMVRIARLPSRIALEGIDTTLDENIIKRMEAHREFQYELNAYEWAMRASSQHSHLIDRYLRAFEANSKPIWRAFAMAGAMELGRMDVAQRIAPDFIDAPLPQLQAEARKILGMGE